MRFSLLLIIVIFATTNSCNREVELSDIEGVWSFFSDELQYAEMVIDSFQIDGMNTVTGGMLPIDFQLKSDSILFVDSDFSAKIEIHSDTMFYMISDTISYIFCRLDDSLRQIYGNKDMSIEEFDKNFFELRRRASSDVGKRARSLWLKENYNITLEE